MSLSRRLTMVESMTIEIPWWWGAAYDQFDSVVLYPIPLNIIIRIGRDLLGRLQGPRWWKTREEEIYKIARQHAEASFNARLKYYRAKDEISRDRSKDL